MAGVRSPRSEGNLDVTFDGKRVTQAPNAPRAKPVAPGSFRPDGTQVDSPIQSAKPAPLELEQGWFRADAGRLEQAELAPRHLQAIGSAVEELKSMGRCPTGRWTNDPLIFPDGMFPAVLPFPPENEQVEVPELPPEAQEALVYGDQQEENDEEEEDDEDEDAEGEENTRPWLRLSQFGQTQEGTCVLFDESKPDATNFGRIFRGQLDNSYLVEALNAVSLRPALARQLFYAYDVQRCIYIVRLFKNGIWMRVEVDDYVPPSTDGQPFCCRSEHFPYVLWPSIVEKAYAKVCTLRDPSNPAANSGGWNAVGGGGNVEEALADLTGGVAGRFYTHDVTADRLFIYLNTLQRDCLWVCRVDTEYCAKKRITLTPYAYHVVNRAASYDGHCYVQVFCSSPTGVHDGGLSDLTVPSQLVNEYPEKSWQGFFWLAIEDFHCCFDTIFECRLTNTPDVGIAGMPPPRLPAAVAAIVPEGLMPPSYFETVFANPGIVTERSPPEISVTTPGVPCEVILTVQQTDSRIIQVGSSRKPYVPILLKVYESLGADNVYSTELVCKSNWLPIRDSMVAFKTSSGGTFKVIAEMPPGAACDRLIIRCYSSVVSTSFNVSPSMYSHKLSYPQYPPNAVSFSLVGTVDRSRLASPEDVEPLVEDLDALRQRHKDHNWCSVM